jgi:hypothetical protein
MLTRFIARILGKKIYKSEIIITSDEFTAYYESDCLFASLKWVIAGLYESAHYSSTTDSNQSKNIVIGKISEFKLFSLSSSSIVLFGYNKPKNEDLMFLSNNMVYIPDRILKTLRKEEVDLTKLDGMFK